MTKTVNILTERGARAEDGAERLNGAIARRIAVLRRRQRLSFDDLTARSGVSKGMLVQLEQGRSNPSIATLCRLATGLRVSVADLIATDDASETPVRIVSDEAKRVLWNGPNGGSAALLVGSGGPDMLELWDWTLESGERYKARPHARGTFELVHVVAGSLALEVDGVTHVVAAGDSALAHTDRPHAYACGGKRRARFTMVVSERAPARVR